VKVAALQAQFQSDEAEYQNEVAVDTARKQRLAQDRQYIAESRQADNTENRKKAKTDRNEG
jgi:hypothetical protein